MIGLAVALCLQSTWTDFHTGLILNKNLKRYALAGLAANIIYYGYFCQDCLAKSALNLAVIAVIAIGFYALHVWSAGDSKLLLTIVFLLPGRVFWVHSSTVVPSVYIFMAIFSLGYLYLIAEAIFLDVKNRAIQWPKITKDACVRTSLSFFRGFLFLYGWNTLLGMLFPAFVGSNVMLISLISYFLITIIRDYAFYETKWFLALCAVADILLAAWSNATFNISDVTYMLKSYSLVLLVMFATWIASKYSYETIPTESVKAGMVLSKSTTILFGPSRVKGLPQDSFEDLRSRLTEDEADSVRRWASSKYGKPTVVIVRKIPFASFISLGTGVMIVYNVATHFSV